jgi:hypothetical protein
VVRTARSSAAKTPAGLDGLLDATTRLREKIVAVIEGKRDKVRLTHVVLLAEGHPLIAGVPGVG